MEAPKPKTREATMRELRLKIREEHSKVEVNHEGAYTHILIFYKAMSAFGYSKYNPFDMKKGLPYSKEMGELKALNHAIEVMERKIEIAERHNRATVRSPVMRCLRLCHE